MTDEKTEKENREFTRRTFIGAVAAVGAGAGPDPARGPVAPLTFVDVAPDGPVLKAGLIGCGERGTGAALEFSEGRPQF